MNRKGQILIEALVAITVAGVGLLGVFSLLTQSLGLNKVVSDQFIASNLAMEGVELIKNLIDNNVLQGSGSQAWNGGNCLSPTPTPSSHEIDIFDSTCSNSDARVLKFNPSTGIYSYGVGENTRFTRKIIIERPSTDEVKVNSIVTWKGRGGLSSEINLEDHFFKWRPPQCNDGLDNDGIGGTDFPADSTCLSKDGDTE